MHSNLATAKQSIQAELSHARQGIAFYTERVEALETALAQLEHVESETGTAAPDKRPKQRKAGRSGKAAVTARRGRADANTANAKQQPKSRGRASAKQAPGTNQLPKTGVDFWLELVTDTPRTAVEIANEAVSRLKLKADQKDQIQKLKQRVAPALATLVSAQKIDNAGAGRERRYFKSGSGRQLH